MLQRKCSTVKRKCSSEEVQCRGSAVQGVAGGGEMGLWGKGRNTKLVCTVCPKKNVSIKSNTFFSAPRHPISNSLIFLGLCVNNLQMLFCDFFVKFTICTHEFFCEHSNFEMS